MITEAILLELVRFTSSNKDHMSYTALFVDSNGQPLKAVITSDNKYASLLPKLCGKWVKLETVFKRGRNHIEAVQYSAKTDNVTIMPKA